MSTAMFTTLHGEENKVANGWRISRWKFFVRFYALSDHLIVTNPK